MYDYHVHSRYSSDAAPEIEDCATAAIQKGLSEICFTEHLEIDYPYSDAHFDGLEVPSAYTSYQADITKAQSLFSDLKIKMGMEATLVHEALPKISAVVKQGNYDFVIASQHSGRGKDPWIGDYFDNWGLREGQQFYLEEMLENITAFEDFDVIGHIGYVDKYLNKYKNLGEDPQPFQYRDFPDVLDAILQSAISRGKGIELNTQSYPLLGHPLPHPSIIRRFAELGGEVLTTGSDAHTPEGIARSFSDAAELLKDCGVKYICTFDRRKPTFHKL